MSKTLAISLVISASLSGAFHTAMGNTKRTMDRTGKTIDDLTGKQKALRNEIAKLPETFSGTFTPTLNRMLSQSRKMGEMIDSLSVKQKRLVELSRQSSALRDERRELRGRMTEAAAAGVAVGAPAVQSIRIAAGFEDQVKDIAITGNLPRREEMRLGRAIRENASRSNQSQDELAKGVAVLVANGMQVSEARTYSYLLGKTATATRGQMDELAQLMFSLNTSFKVSGESGMQEALDSMAHAGKQGQFELKHMARYFPELGAAMASFGSTGLSSVRELGMAMQVARKYAGTNEEAATNARNWFSHMTANTTVENFKKVGIDYRGEIMKRMQQQNISALQASLQVTDDFVDRVAAGKTITVKKGKKVEQLSFRSALDRARASGDESAIKSVVERFGLSKIFQDIQTLNFYMAMRQGKDIFKQGMASYNTAEAKGVIDRDFNKRLESSNEQFKRFKIQSLELGIAIGETLLPPLTRFLSVVTPIVGLIGGVAARFPRLTAGVVGLSTGLMLGRVAFLAAAYGGKTLMSTLVGVRTVATLAQTKLLLLRATTMGWNFAGFVGGIKSATMMLRGFAATAVAATVPLLPWAFAIAGVGAAAYMAWKHWSTLKQPGFFRDLKNWIKDETLLGQLYQGGKNLVLSVWQGMKTMAMKPIAVIKDIAQKIRNHLPFSPAKEGPLRDIHRIRLVETIADSIKPGPMVNAMRGATAATMLAVSPVAGLAHANQLPAVSQLARPSGADAGGGMTIKFAPQIIIQGGGNAEQVQGAVNQAMQRSYAEFEKFMQRYEAQKQRRSF